MRLFFPRSPSPGKDSRSYRKPAGDIYQSDLKGLTNFSADSAGITDLTGLEFCTGLTYLSLAYNGISDISPLVENSGLGQGATVDLVENPLDTTSLDVYIPQLQQRGVILGWGTSHPTPPTPTPLTTPPEFTPSPPTPSPTPVPEKKETPFNIWVIIGPVLGVLAAGGATYYVVRKRR